MNKSLWQQLKPHAIAIGIFLVVSCLYCLPALKGLTLDQYDMSHWEGVSKQSFDYKAKYGHFPLWTNSAFSGMPTYQIAVESKHEVTIAWLHYLFTLKLPQAPGLFFLACVGFYILCMSLGLRSWVGILGSIGYAYASYSAVIMAVGHISKFSSIGYAPAVLAGLVLLTQRKYVLGFLATLLFSTLLFYQNHLQVVYYFFLMAGCLGVAYAVVAIREKAFKHLLIIAGLAVVAIVMGLASFAVILMPTNDYAKESSRGGRSELTAANNKTDKTKGGLDKDYAFNWSYGLTETFTFITPRIFGGSSPNVINNQSVNELGDHSKTAEVLAERTGMPEDQANDFVKQSFSAYWGPQPITHGTVYFGAVITFLFIMGLMVYRGWHLGWIIAATIVGILMAWGKNFSALNYFLFDHLPYYNKFRAPTTSLIIPQLTFPLLAALGLNELINLKEKGQTGLLWKKFKWSAYIMAGVMVILAGLYFSANYTSSNDQSMRENLTNYMAQQLARGAQPTAEMQQQASDFGRSVTNALKEDRRSLFGGDLIRSLIFVALSAGLIFLYIRNKLNVLAMLLILTGLNLIDLIGVDLRYLSHNNFKEKEESTEFTPSQADLQIKQDTGYYRVYNAGAGSIMSDSRTSYFHNSIGGYSAARIALYEDIITHQLSKGNMKVFNMLNTKYFIVNDPNNRQPVAQQNPEALGPVWFVKTIRYVNNADEEMKALDTFEPRDTVVIDKREQAKISFTPQYDSASTIRLVQHQNEKLIYQSDAAAPQFAVFSEVYYSRGWKAFIDNKEVPIVKVNYVLRGLPIPAGKHTIEFRFEPRVYMLGDTISLIDGILSILVMLAGIWYLWKQYRSAPPHKRAEL
jgi:hypothetical protein